MPKPPWEPRGLDDLAWRIKYRLQQAGFTIFGPPQLGPTNDPLVRLARERTERYAHRRPA